jgi:hypothetical protein
MSFLGTLFGGGLADTVKAVGGVIDDLHTSDDERLQAQIKRMEIEASLLQGQQAINQTEARHKSIFVAGWRPAIGWVGAAALAYQFLLYPFMAWGWSLGIAQGWIPEGVEVPPSLDPAVLMNLIMAMLGVGAMRSYDKTKGTDTERVAR